MNMNILLGPLVAFFDKPRRGKADTSAINGILGEELCATVFKHYLDSCGYSDIKDTDKPPTMGTKKGKRLDTWINATKKDGTKVLYQCEIKNWTASSKGGLTLELDCDQQTLEEVAREAWRRQLETDMSGDNKDLTVTKVLLPMKVPTDLQGAEVEPLVIYWMPISNSTSGDPEPFFKTPIEELHLPKSVAWGDFRTLNVFSISLYLRRLLKEGKKELKLEMPNASRRVEVLKKLCALH
jgi:hypothetical protein